MGETVKGGRYLTASGKVVDANGKPVTEKAQAEETGPEALPPEFPGRMALEKAGITTLSGLSEYGRPLTEIRGIGTSTAEDIKAALKR